MKNLATRFLISLLVALALMCVHKLSHATTYIWDSKYSSASDACVGGLASRGFTAQGYVISNVVFVSVSDARCYARQNGGVEQNMFDTYRTISATCVSGASTSITMAWGDAKGNMLPAQGAPTSDGSCEMLKPKMVRCFVPHGSTMAQSYCIWSGIQTGAATPAGAGPVSSSATPDASATPSPATVAGSASGGCPSGTSNVGTDSAGTAMCVGSGVSPVVPTATTTTTPTSTVTTGSGSAAVTTTTDVSATTNTDGSVTTTTKTCATPSGGATTCSTGTATGSTPSGLPGVPNGKPGGTGAGASGDASTPPDDFCSLHPNLNVCSNSQVTGNACNGAVSSIAVSGDAIQGAILRQQLSEYCGNAAQNPLVDKGNAAIAGTDNTQDPFKNSTTVGVSMFDTSDSISGTCPAPADVALPMGGSIHIPFDAICGFAAIMRPILIAAAAFGALVFVYGGI
jgi:hypothetical protein